MPLYNNPNKMFRKLEHSLVGHSILVLSPTPTYPTNAGNRKRIYHYCRELQMRGAKIHFLYYPFEWWFSWIPQKDITAMTGQWDSFSIVPSTIPIQAPPIENKIHHHIDEWWDGPALEPMLTWLFQRKHYDAFIVNYPYLSKAFEFAPSDTLKILDMHDQFSGRRELLERMGSSPEFFYTTAEQEKVALDRADLIWAIKEEEAIFFRTLTEKPVVTMPHIEPEVVIERLRIPEDEGYLVLGMVGARNTINYRNAMVFIEEVLPILSRYLAPVKIRFGGGMCMDFESWTELPAGIELVGQFDKSEEFYATVDAMLVPLTFSTGLKIKAVEAFALGMPVIAHKHAVEGIPVTHPFHRCQSMRELALACVELAFDQGRLSELKRSTHETYIKLRELAETAFDNTIRAIIKKPTIIVAVHTYFLRKNLYRQHVLQTIDYLKYLGKVVCFIDGPKPYGFHPDIEQFCCSGINVVFSPEIPSPKDLGERDSCLHAPLLPNYEEASLAELCLHRKPIALWLLDLPQEVCDGIEILHHIPKKYARLDVLRQLNTWNDTELSSIFDTYPSLYCVSSGEPYTDLLCSNYVDRYINIPYWRCGLECDLYHNKNKHTMLIMATIDTMYFSFSILKMILSVKFKEIHKIIIVLPTIKNCIDAKEEYHFDVDIAQYLCSCEEMLNNDCKWIDDHIIVLNTCALDIIHSIVIDTVYESTKQVYPIIDLVSHINTDKTIYDIVDILINIHDYLYNVNSFHLKNNDEGWQTIWKEISTQNLFL